MSPPPEKDGLTQFSPFIWALVERRTPSPIFTVAYTGVRYWLYTELTEDLVNLDFHSQIELVSKEILKRHLERPKTPFGRTLGYLFIQKPEAVHEFTINGSYIGIYDGIIPHLSASLDWNLID